MLEGCSGLYDHTCEECGDKWENDYFYDVDNPVVCATCFYDNIKNEIISGINEEEE